VSAFDRALAFTLGVEGGEANVTGDRGGHTYRGITQRLYNACRAAKGLPEQDVANATDEEIQNIAREQFWQPCKCDDLPEGLAIVVFDMAFNSSPANAKKTLQKALGVSVDGVVGPGTLAAARAAGDKAALAFLKARAGFLVEDCIHDTSQLIFLHGWFDRCLDLAHEVNA
jgi:lysozyme family protein